MTCLVEQVGSGVWCRMPCLAMRAAMAPATRGAANDVPLQIAYPLKSHFPSGPRPSKVKKLLTILSPIVHASTHQP